MSAGSRDPTLARPGNSCGETTGSRVVESSEWDCAVLDDSDDDDWPGGGYSCSPEGRQVEQQRESMVQVELGESVRCGRRPAAVRCRDQYGRGEQLCSLEVRSWMSSWSYSWGMEAWRMFCHAYSLWNDASTLASLWMRWSRAMCKPWWLWSPIRRWMSTRRCRLLMWSSPVKVNRAVHCAVLEGRATCQKSRRWVRVLRTLWLRRACREMQSTSSMVFRTMSEPGCASSTCTVEIVGHVIGRSQSSVADVTTACERRKRKICRKALVKFDELVMLMTIEKPKDKGKAKVEGKVDASTIMLDLVDRLDEVVVGMADRVVKARVVYRVPKEQRDGARDTRCVRGVPSQQTSAEIGGGELRARVGDLWSSTLRWDVQSAGSQIRDRRKIFTHKRELWRMWRCRTQQWTQPAGRVFEWPERSWNRDGFTRFSWWRVLSSAIWSPWPKVKKKDRNMTIKKEMKRGKRWISCHEKTHWRTIEAKKSENINNWKNKKFKRQEI